MTFADEVNELHKDNNSPKSVDLYKIATDIYKDVKVQFKLHPKIVTHDGLFRLRKEFQVYIQCDINIYKDDKKSTFIAYDSGDVDIRYVHFSSKDDYEKVYRTLQQLCVNDGVKMVKSNSKSFLFTIPCQE